MRKPLYFVLAAGILSINSTAFSLETSANELESKTALEAKEIISSSEKAQQENRNEEFKTFTGKVIGKNVRLRLQPNLDGYILREVNNDEMFLVLGEENGFYAVKPTSDIKAYIYRTFVLDGVVEGSRVNVRLRPHLEAPVLTQVESGTPAEGIVSPINSRWLEIAPPESTRFFIAKEYIDFAGDPSLLATIEQRRNEVHHLINSAYLIAQSEIRKPFEEISLEQITEAFEKIVTEYTDFPEHVNKAKEVLSLVHETYLQKKVAFLESKTESSSRDWATKDSELSQQIASYESRLAELEEELNLPSAQLAIVTEEESTEKVEPLSNQPAMEELSVELFTPTDTTSSMIITEDFPRESFTNAQSLLSSDSENNNLWDPVEKSQFHKWAANNPEKTLEDFYLEEKLNAEIITGRLEPYSRPVKNKPGDFVLKKDNITIAFLYSTKIDLQNNLGQQVTIRGNRRPNHHFAFPAFHVLSVE